MKYDGLDTNVTNHIGLKLGHLGAASSNHCVGNLGHLSEQYA